MKYIFAFLAILLINSTTYAQGTQCTAIQKNIDLINRQIEQVERKIAQLESNYASYIKSAKLTLKLAKENARNRAKQSRQYCLLVYNKSVAANKNCSQSILSDLLGDGECDKRDKIIKENYKTCMNKAETTLDYSLEMAEQRFIKYTESAKIKFNSRKAQHDAELQRHVARLEAAQAELTACKNPPAPQPEMPSEQIPTI